MVVRIYSCSCVQMTPLHPSQLYLRSASVLCLEPRTTPATPIVLYEDRFKSSSSQNVINYSNEFNVIFVCYYFNSLNSKKLNIREKLSSYWVHTLRFCSTTNDWFLHIILKYVTSLRNHFYRTRKVMHFTAKFTTIRHSGRLSLVRIVVNYFKNLDSNLWSLFASLSQKKEVRHMSRNILIKLLSFVIDDQDISSCN